MSRNEISAKASMVEDTANKHGTLVYDGTEKSEQWQSEWFSLAGELHQLSNDCCESQHKVVDLQKRLVGLKIKFADTLSKYEESLK